MILSQHIPIYDEIFNLPGFLSDPLLSFGFQDVVVHDRVKPELAKNKEKRQNTVIYNQLRDEISALTSSEFYEVTIPHQFVESDLNAILRNYAVNEIHTIDLFDDRADYKHDMNEPVPENLKGKFSTVIDIGSIEHVFDTRQCFENLVSLLSINGRILLHTPCCGYFNHGFHTFSPECVLEALRLNGCEIEYMAYSLEPEGIKIEQPVTWGDVILWCVARKTRKIEKFCIPQQTGCQRMYGLVQGNYSDGTLTQNESRPGSVPGQADLAYDRKPASPAMLVSATGRDPSPIEDKTLYLGLVKGKNYGWGVCSQYLIEELSRMINCHVLNSDDGSDSNPGLDGKLFQAITGIDFIPMFEKARGGQNIGYTFFENELNPKSTENARQYDLVLGGSSWCRDRMLEKGIANCDVLIQGIDPNIFFPIENSGHGNPFVIFSGGKFELRKGQDLVLRAVKILQDKYDDIVLANCWYNIWPESMRWMAHSRYIEFEYKELPWLELMQSVYLANGLDSRRIKTFELVPNEMQRSLYAQTDLGVFPNRCEGGTNLVMMEYMACGKPVVAANTTGQADIVSDQNALLLNNNSPYNIAGPDNQLIARWQEPSLDELVAQIEYAYHHRDEIRQLGKRAGADMKNYTWAHTAQNLMRMLFE